MRHSLGVVCALIVCVVIGFFGFSYAFEQQGFASMTELGEDRMQFQCNNECYVLLGPTAGYDRLVIQGLVQGAGMMAYGLLASDQQVYVLYNQGITNNTNLSVAQNLSDIPGYTQLQDNNPGAQLLVIFQGTLSSNDFLVDLQKLTFGQQIIQGFHTLFAVEPMTPYSINLRYGARIGGNSIVGIGYVLFILFVLVVVFFVRQSRAQKYHLLMWAAIILFLFIGLRNMRAYTRITTQGIHYFSDNGSYYDLGDYIPLTQEIRRVLGLDETHKESCSVWIDSYQERPYTVHRDAVYLRPCVVVADKAHADYLLYHKKEVSPEDNKYPVLLQMYDSVLLDVRG